MWSSQKKLKILYRSAFDIEKITNRISNIVSKRTDIPFSIEKLHNFHDLLKQRLHLLVIFRKYPDSYNSVLNGTNLPQEINEELRVYLKDNENGIKEYRFLREIRKKKYIPQRFKDLEKYYNETLKSFKLFEKDYHFILDNLEIYNNILHEKETNKTRQEQVKRHYLKKSNKVKGNEDDEDDREIENLQHSLEKLGIEN